MRCTHIVLVEVALPRGNVTGTAVGGGLLGVGCPVSSTHFAMLLDEPTRVRDARWLRRRDRGAAVGAELRWRKALISAAVAASTDASLPKWRLSDAISARHSSA